MLTLPSILRVVLLRRNALLSGAVGALVLAAAPAVSHGQSAALPATTTLSPTTTQAVDRPIEMDESTMLTHAITKAAPVYPAEAKGQHLSGAVVVYAIINENGTVKSLSILSGPNIFRIAALTALNQWTFQPYQVNGQPAKVGTIFTVTFTPPAS